MALLFLCHSIESIFFFLFLKLGLLKTERLKRKMDSFVKPTFLKLILGPRVLSFTQGCFFF